MKWFSTLTVALLPATALGRFVSKRDDITTTDTYLFDISLAQFIEYRDAQDPATLDWDSDGCTDSPDNPLGFDYVSFFPQTRPKSAIVELYKLSAKMTNVWIWGGI